MRPSVGASLRGAGVALEQRVLRLGVERGGRLVEHQHQRLVAHEAARQRQLLPLAERDVDALGPGRPQLRVQPRRSRSTTSSAPARPTAARHRRLVVEARHVADADRLPRAELEAKEVLKGAGQARRATSSADMRASGCAVDQDLTRRRLVELAEQLHERGLARAVFADDGHHRAGRQLERDVLEHQPLGAGIGERHVLQADARARNCAGHGHVGLGDERRGVVLEPGQPPRAVHPDAAQEANLADRGADVCRQSGAGRQHQQHARGGAPARRRRRPPRQRTPRRRSPRPACARPREAQRARAIGAVPVLPRRTAPAISRSPMPVTRTSLPGGAVVASMNRWRASRFAGRAALLGRAFDRRPPGRREHGRQREQRQQHQPRAESTPAERPSPPGAGSSRTW